MRNQKDEHYRAWRTFLKTVKIIASKSDAHRAYIASAIAFYQRELDQSATFDEVFSCVKCGDTSRDIDATKSCLLALLNEEGNAGADLYCGESGTTLRFLLPIVGALGVRGVFYPEGRLSRRPIAAFRDELICHGMSVSEEGSIPIIAEGNLSPGIFILPGNISSQFISGLLFALPVLDGDSQIIIEGRLESAPYVDMTLSTLKSFGIEIESGKAVSNESDRIDLYFSIKGNQKYIAPEEYIVEGDWSNAAFWLSMGALGSDAVRVEGVNLDSRQGDKQIIDVMKRFGIKAEKGEDFVIAYPSRKSLKGITIDAKDTPDMVPALALIASLAKGKTKITNAGRLRLKESDRLHTITECLRKMGAKIEELDDGLIITGVEELHSANVESFSDHRIAMMVAAASTSITEKENKIGLIGFDAVNKSYPEFFSIFHELKLDENLELI